MSTERANPFADLTELPSFNTKPRAQKPVDTKAIEQIARDQNFPSRQAAKDSPPPRKRRAYTTGRNQQLNFKATAETADRFYAMADSRGVKLCELLEQALDALEKKGANARPSELAKNPSRLESEFVDKSPTLHTHKI